MLYVGCVLVRCVGVLVGARTRSVVVSSCCRVVVSWCRASSTYEWSGHRSQDIVTHSHPLTHSLAHSHTQSTIIDTQSSLTHSRSLTHNHSQSLTHSLSRSLSLSTHGRSLSRSLALSVASRFTYFFGQPNLECAFIHFISHFKFVPRRRKKRRSTKYEVRRTVKSSQVKSSSQRRVPSPEGRWSSKSTIQGVRGPRNTVEVERSSKPQHSTARTAQHSTSTPSLRHCMCVTVGPGQSHSRHGRHGRDKSTGHAEVKLL